MSKPEVVEEEVLQEDIGACIEIPPYRIFRADTNNIVLQKLKKRKTSDDTYWDTEGYYNSLTNAVFKLFYKDISAKHIETIKELEKEVKISEARILKAISNIKL